MPEPTTTSPASMGGPLSEAERLAEIRARWGAITPGPWHVTVFDDDHAMNLVAVATVADTDASSEIVAATLVQAPRYVDVADGRWDENAEAIANAPSDMEYLLELVGVLEGQLATAQAEAVQLNSQLKDPGLDWLIDWAMGTDREARDHYFHINDGEGDSCGCRYADEGALGLDGGGSGE